MNVKLNIVEAPPQQSVKAVTGDGTAMMSSQGPKARPLRFWQETLTRSNGRMQGPDGQEHAISLARWATADPDTTMLAIYFQFIDPEMVGKKDPSGSR